MKALYKDGEMLCRKNDNLRDYFEAATGMNYDEELMRHIRDYELEDEFTVAKAEADFEEQFWYDVEEGAYSDEGLEIREESEDAEEHAGKICVYLTPDGRNPRMIDCPEVPSHMNRGCPICDGKLMVIGVEHKSGHRMPDLAYCVCESCGTRTGHELENGVEVVADQETQ